jgi:prepilin-type N-terminal cleavage/methylation domain-containing protein
MGGTNRNSGFSMTELLCVVAIISIIASITVPQFQRFARRAQEVSVKAELSGIYSASRTFLFEYGAYSTALNQIGYLSEGMKRFYRVGFPDGSQVCQVANAAGGAAIPNQVSCGGMGPQNAVPVQSIKANIVASGGPAAMQAMMTGSWVGNSKTQVYPDPAKPNGAWEVYGLRMTEPGQLEIFTLNENKQLSYELLKVTP